MDTSAIVILITAITTAIVTVLAAVGSLFVSLRNTSKIEANTSKIDSNHLISTEERGKLLNKTDIIQGTVNGVKITVDGQMTNLIARVDQLANMLQANNLVLPAANPPLLPPPILPEEVKE